MAHEVFSRLLQKATPASARSAGSSEQGLAPRSNPAAARAARGGFGHRTRGRAPAVREAASRGWRRGQTRPPRERHGAVLGTARGGERPQCGKQRAGVGAAVKPGRRESGTGRFWAPQGEAGSRGRAPDAPYKTGNREQGQSPDVSHRAELPSNPVSHRKYPNRKNYSSVAGYYRVVVAF